MLKKASVIKNKPIINAETPSLKLSVKSPKKSIIMGTDPRTKFGIVLAAVDRIFVPNCSAAIVTNMAQ